MAPLRAQNQPASDPASAPIVTDRPSVTDASIVVPAGSIQLENGFLDDSTQALRTLDGPETLIRVGLLAKTELRLYVPDYYYYQSLDLSSPAAPGSGFGDLAIGVKQQLGPLPGKFDLSVVAYLSIPTGARAISSHAYDPAWQMPWSRTLSPKWTLAGMLSLYLPTQSGRRNLIGEPTFLLDRQLTALWSGFVEYAGDFSQHAGRRDLAHFGTALSVSKRQQLDFHVGVGSMAGMTYHYLWVRVFVADSGHSAREALKEVNKNCRSPKKLEKPLTDCGGVGTIRNCSARQMFFRVVAVGTPR